MSFSCPNSKEPQLPNIKVSRGNSPILLGMPHTGVWMPQSLSCILNQTGLALADTDWHIDRLYSGLLPEASIVRTTVHRYVIDPNRDPAGQSLYTGVNTTALCPTTDFDGKLIYQLGKEPSEDEVERRIASYHLPYHNALKAELERIKAQHGFAILFDCHSIRPRIPFLFDGTLTDFNIGTNCGNSCSPQLEQIVLAGCNSSRQHSTALNARFKGGWTTRHYGAPAINQHAIQMELAQSSYMQEYTQAGYDANLARGLRKVLKQILEQLSNWKPF